MIVPLVLTMTVVATALAVVSTSVGCDDETRPVDAGIGDGMPDTPII